MTLHIVASEKQTDTQKLWENIKAGEYEVCISPAVLIELDVCAEPKRSGLLACLGDIEYTELDETEEVLTLAAQYSEAGILPKKSNRDRQHIAYACVYDCDNLVNYKTISGVKGVNALAGYREMPIYSPTMLIENLRHRKRNFWFHESFSENAVNRSTL